MVPIEVMVIRGLIRPLILGWDFMKKHGCVINIKKGKFEFTGNGVTDLLPSPAQSMGSVIAVAEDFAVAANAKMHVKMDVASEESHERQNGDQVLVEPLYTHGSRVLMARCISKIEDGRAMVELLNTSK